MSERFTGQRMLDGRRQAYDTVLGGWVSVAAIAMMHGVIVPVQASPVKDPR